MSDDTLAIVIFVLKLVIMWHSYYIYITKEIKLAKAERVNKLVGVVKYIGKLSQKVSIIPATSALYRILYGRQITLIKEIEKEAPDHPLVREILPAIQEKMDEIDDIDDIDVFNKQRNVSLPLSEGEAIEVCKIIYRALQFIERESKYIDTRFIDIHKERERLSTMMVQIKCEILHNRSVRASNLKRRGDEIFYLEKALEIIFENDNDSFSSLKAKLETDLEKAKLKKAEAHKIIKEQPDDSGLDRVTSDEKSHWR